MYSFSFIKFRTCFNTADNPYLWLSTLLKMFSFSTLVKILSKWGLLSVRWQAKYSSSTFWPPKQNVHLNFLWWTLVPSMVKFQREVVEMDIWTPEWLLYRASMIRWVHTYHIYKLFCPYSVDITENQTMTEVEWWLNTCRYVNYIHTRYRLITFF